MTIRVENINGRKIAIDGIAKAFYQDGYPITLAIDECKKQGVEVSLLHVADQLLKHGWEAKTVINKLRNDAMEGISGEINTTNWDQLNKFCNSTYEDQREMIFQYLFSETSQQSITGEGQNARSFFKYYATGVK